MELASGLRKDNFDAPPLKNLFIGSEGQFGVITEVAINVPARPKSSQLAFLGKFPAYTILGWKERSETTRKDKDW